MLNLPIKKPPDLRLKAFSLTSGISWNRTSDTRIFSPLLYQLSYDTALLGIANVAFFFVAPIFFSKRHHNAKTELTTHPNQLTFQH